MKATFVTVLVAMAALMIGCRDSSVRKSTSHSEDTVEKVVAGHLITGYFRKQELAQEHGAFFLVVPHESEAALTGFMADFRPRVELGIDNMQEVKSERPILRDSITGLPSVLVHISAPKIANSEATVEAYTQGPGGGAYYTFILNRTARGWVISKESVVLP